MENRIGQGKYADCGISVSRFETKKITQTIIIDSKKLET